MTKRGRARALRISIAALACLAILFLLNLKTAGAWWYASTLKSQPELLESYLEEGGYKELGAIRYMETAPGHEQGIQLLVRLGFGSVAKNFPKAISSGRHAYPVVSPQRGCAIPILLLSENTLTSKRLTRIWSFRRTTRSPTSEKQLKGRALRVLHHAYGKSQPIAYPLANTSEYELLFIDGNTIANIFFLEEDDPFRNIPQLCALWPSLEQRRLVMKTSANDKGLVPAEYFRDMSKPVLTSGTPK